MELHCLNCNKYCDETDATIDDELGLLCPFCGAALVEFVIPKK